MKLILNLMLLKVLDGLTCPKCQSASKIWKLEGDVSDTRVADAKAICPQDHIWQVREEILRFDSEKSDEDMIFLDHDRTGFPKEVGELERGDFLFKIEDYFENIKFDSQHVLIKGEPILYFKYMKPGDQQLITVYPNEGILRQLQVLAVKKQFYSNASFIRAKDASMLGDVSKLVIFQKVEDNKDLNKGDRVLQFKKKEESAKGKIIWEGEKTFLDAITID